MLSWSFYAWKWREGPEEPMSNCMEVQPSPPPLGRPLPSLFSPLPRRSAGNLFLGYILASSFTDNKEPGDGLVG